MNKFYKFIMDIFKPYDPDNWFTKKPKGWNPVTGRCPQCNLQLHNVMWYVCSCSNCPVFKKGNYNGN